MHTLRERIFAEFVKVNLLWAFHVHYYFYILYVLTFAPANARPLRVQFVH